MRDSRTSRSPDAEEGDRRPFGGVAVEAEKADEPGERTDDEHDRHRGSDRLEGERLEESADDRPAEKA